MGEIASLEKFLWGVLVLFKAALFILLLYRKNSRIYPYFFAYVLFTLLHDPFLFARYRIWGFNSPTVANLAWSTQGLVISARALAVAEICRRVLGIYRGIWVLAWRTFLVTAGIVLLFSWAVARHDWQTAILNADRGIELTIATVICLFFLFAQQYEIALRPTDRSLVIGFFLYSCFCVLDNTFLEVWLWRYQVLWNLLATLAFIATLLVWISAVRETQMETVQRTALLPSGAHARLAPVINDRLRVLNEHLHAFWNVKSKDD